MERGEYQQQVLSNAMLSQMSVEGLKKYIEDKSVAIKEHKDYGRPKDAEIDQGFLNQAAVVLDSKINAGLKVA